MTIAVANALCRCTFGTMCSVNVLPTTNVFISGKRCVRSSDAKAFINLSSFGMCCSPTNPDTKKTPVGAIIPTICFSQISNPTWFTKKNNVKVCGETVCTNGDTCMCMYQGIITIEFPGQVSVS